MTVGMCMTITQSVVWEISEGRTVHNIGKTKLVVSTFNKLVNEGIKKGWKI